MRVQRRAIGPVDAGTVAARPTVTFEDEKRRQVDGFDT
jgi:hypothetical protein